MDHISNLRIFRSVVDARSFSRAANLQGVSPAVVTRAISTLEQHLGNRLFHRTTRTVAMTAVAERFYDGCCRLLDELDALEADARDESREASGQLRVVAHATAAVSRLVPLISSFRRHHPKVTLSVTLTERPVDLVRDGYDLGIVLPFMLESDRVITRPLERIPGALVATPDYILQKGMPCEPSDLTEHNLVGMPASYPRTELCFQIGKKTVYVPMRQKIASNNAQFNLSMTLKGFGIGILPITVAENSLNSGELVRVLGDYQIKDEQTEIRLAYVSRTLLPSKVRAFVDHATTFFECLHQT
ncbi:LysR family transcriptional regulator [Paraburkholderia jirisanensis]